MTIHILGVFVLFAISTISVCEQWLNVPLEKRWKVGSIKPKRFPDIDLDLLKSNEPSPLKTPNRLEKRKDKNISSFRKYANKNRLEKLAEENSMLDSKSENNISYSPYSNNLKNLENLHHYSTVEDKIDLLPPIERHRILRKLQKFPEIFDQLQLAPCLMKKKISERRLPSIQKEPPNKFEQMLSKNPPRAEKDMLLQIVPINDIPSQECEYVSPYKYVPASCKESAKSKQMLSKNLPRVEKDMLLQIVPIHDIPFREYEYKSPDKYALASCKESTKPMEIYFSFKDFALSGWCSTPDTDATKF